MKVIDTKIHGCLDYIVALILIASPLMFDFARNGAETWVPLILGIGTVVYSLLTNYELSLWPRIPMRIHLVLDTLSALLLATSPWLFGFAKNIWQPFLILGIIELLIVWMSKTKPSDSQTTAEKRVHRTAGVH
jgi:hypothetical protein